MRDSNGTLWTPTCLIMWPNLFTATAPKGSDKLQFSATAVLDGNEPDFAAFRNELQEELDRASREKHGATIREMKQRGKFKVAVKQNNDPETGKAAKPGFKERPGGFHFSATSNFRPAVMDKDFMGVAPDREDEFYSGMFGKVGISAWGWDHPTGGKGVSLNLLGVWKLFDGDKLAGGGITAADMAKSLENDGYVPAGAQEAPSAGSGGQQQSSGEASGPHDQTPAGGDQSFGF